MSPLRRLLSLCALASLPLSGHIASAASIPLANGEICFDEKSASSIDFPNGFIAYDYLCQLFTQFDTNAGSGGFHSLNGLDGSQLFIVASGLKLTSYSAPDATGPIFLEYLPEDPYPSWSLFWHEITDPEDPDFGNFTTLLDGTFTSLRLEADAFPTPDGSQTMRVYAHIVLDNVTSDGEPLGDAFYDELMTLTNNTGNLYLSATAILYDGFLEFGAAELSTVIPEPGTLAALFALAALGVSVARRRR